MADNPNSAGGVGKYLGLALMLPISTAVGYGLGYGLDHLFHTTWLRWLFLAFGTAGGFIDLVREAGGDSGKGQNGDKP